MDCSGVYVYSAGAPPPAYLEAAQGHWQAADNSGMHDYIRMQLSALAPSPSRPGQTGRHLISNLFRGGVFSAAMCRSRGPPPACSSPLGAYSSAAGHHMTPHYLTSPQYLRCVLPYILVEHPPPEYGQSLDCASGHNMTSISYLMSSRHTLSILIHSSICLRNTDMPQYTHISRFVQ